MKSKKSLLNIPLFCAIPFVSFLIAIRNLRSRTNGLIFISFCTLLGFAFAFSNDSADSYRVALVFHEFDYKSLFDIYQLYILGGAPDLYRFFVYATLKSFTENPKLLFATFGLVFGVFWYFSLRIFKKEQGSYTGLYASLLFFIFVIINPITNINGARFNTAIWVFFLATINIVLYKKNRYFLLLICAPLFHFSFLYGVVVVVLFSITRRFLYSKLSVNKFLFYAFVGSFCLSWILESNIISFDFIGNIVPSDSISNKIGTYNSAEVSDIYAEREANSPFLIVSNFFQALMKITFFTIIVYFRNFMEKNGYINPSINRLMAFILFYFVFSFIIATIPSGGRFLMVGYILSLLLMIKMCDVYGLVLNKKYFLALIPVYSFTFFFNTVFLSVTLTSSTIWYGNLFWIIYEGWDYTFIYL
ncbi:hypothetical protein [Dokdonia sp. R78006]|uniref:hypothetical protein n=1 Tax=Dokdonia sp. R78006 TaxID=3093866 RepID=UPI0036D21789